jgi:DNA polymerase-3 subunit gamma/tau
MTALYSRYRSQRFDDLVGQDALVETLKNALRSGRVSHAYLFAGIRGTGKTSTARLVAKAVNCLDPQDGEPCNKCAPCVAITESSATDLIEIDAASNRGIDEMRDLREKAKYMPALLRRKVYIIDEAHQLTNDAFNALLKTLEEPPEHVLFILCTTEAHKLPETVVSRCQRFEFRRITEADISARLLHIATTEKIEVSPEGLDQIAAMAQGSLRDAISMLDQLASSGVRPIDADAVRRQLGLVSAGDIVAILDACARGDAASALRDLDRLTQQGADMRQLVISLAEGARRALLVSLGAVDARGLGFDTETGAALVAAAGEWRSGFAAAAFELGLGAAAEMRQSHDPRLLLELLCVRLAALGGAAEARPPAVRPAAPAAEAKPLARAERPVATKPEPAAEAEAEDQPAPAPARAVTVPVDPGLGAIQERWGSLLDALRGTGPGTRVKALLSEARPVGLDGDLLTLGFRYAMHSEKTQEPPNRLALEQALSDVYGRPFRLQFQVVPDLPSTRPAAAHATDGGGAAPGPAGETLADAAVEALGARIIDVRTRGSDA